MPSRPSRQGFDLFAKFKWPDITRLGDSYYNAEYGRYLGSSPGIWIPLFFTFVLGAIGTNIQIKLLAEHKNRQLMVASKAAALQMK